MERRELILYATPLGDLAENCAEYFARASALGFTTAQTYPPHCTLTGFFHRRTERLPGVAAEVARAAEAAEPGASGTVVVEGLRIEREWIGLDLHSPTLRQLTDDFASAHRLEAGDDTLRLKEWLHLSLAYGVADLAPYADLAEKTIDAGARATWEVALWERRPDGSWLRH